MRNLHENLGSMSYDGLVTDINPTIKVGGGVIEAREAEETLVRGTLLAKKANGKLVVLGEDTTATPYAILCDDTVVGTSDVKAVIYIAGCFDIEKCTAKAQYTVTDANIDAFYTRNIAFKTAQKN